MAANCKPSDGEATFFGKQCDVGGRHDHGEEAGRNQPSSSARPECLPTALPDSITQVVPAGTSKRRGGASIRVGLWKCIPDGPLGEDGVVVKWSGVRQNQT